MALIFRACELDSYRSQIGVVLQDNFLFDGTIKENILFGRPDASDEDVYACRDGRSRRRVRVQDWKTGSTRSSASAALNFPAANVSESPLRERFWPIRAFSFSMRRHRASIRRAKL